MAQRAAALERGAAGMLGAAADGRPVGEGLQVMAIFPGEVEKFAGVEAGGLPAEESFKAPLDVGTLPRSESIAARSEPVKF